MQSLVALKRWKEALALAETLVAELPADDPAIAELDFARGRALLGLARPDEARKVLQAVIDARKNGDLAAQAQLMQGEVYFHQDRFREALKEFLKVDILYDAPDGKPPRCWRRGKCTSDLGSGPMPSRLINGCARGSRTIREFPRRPRAWRVRGSKRQREVNPRVRFSDPSAACAENGLFWEGSHSCNVIRLPVEGRPRSSVAAFLPPSLGPGPRPRPRTNHDSHLPTKLGRFPRNLSPEHSHSSAGLEARSVVPSRICSTVKWCSANWATWFVRVRFGINGRPREIACAGAD